MTRKKREPKPKPEFKVTVNPPGPRKLSDDVLQLLARAFVETAYEELKAEAVEAKEQTKEPQS